ncbi:MAG: sigma-70 family RNA polymerase sigma factor [Planctomycetota bacterium]
MDLTDFINAYRGPLIGLIASWGAPWGDATEIAEDSFAEAWLNRESCRGDWNQPEVFGRWLRGVALNLYRNWARKRQRQRGRTVTLDPAIVESVTAPLPSSEIAERVAVLRKAMEKLPDGQRQVIYMHYLEETSVKQVAALLSVSVKTVEGRLYQARLRLKRLVDGDTSFPQIGRMLLWL